MKIYLAGKIRDRDWRESIVPGLRGTISTCCEADADPAPNWPILKKIIFEKHDYTGPYFVSCDHGCWHGPNQHGCLAQADRQQEVINHCLKGIAQADLIFAWFDGETTNGTLIELGYAYSQKKKIWVAGAEYQADLWFAYGLAEHTLFSSALNPHQSLKALLENYEEKTKTVPILSK